MITNNDKRLFLLDAFALIYRAYFAFSKNPRINSKGFNTSAILGFTNTLMDLLEKEKPSHIAVVFDSPVKTTREEDFAAYKANRQEMPEDIRDSIPYIQNIIKAFKIPLLYADGYEADDVIGTLAKKAEQEGYITYMMTPDKDFGQLVSENIFIYKPARMGNGAEIMGVKEVCDKFEVNTPEQVIDILGMWGDAVDNIPGIPGIGEKTAKKLIKQYHSLEGVIENVHEQRGKLKANIEEFAAQGLLSKKLATIILDVPVEFDPGTLIIEEPNKDQLKKIFADLEFRRLADRVLSKYANGVGTAPEARPSQLDLFGESEANESSNTHFKTIEDAAADYHLIDTKEKRVSLINKLQKSDFYCFDTETTSLNTFEAELVGISFSIKEKEAFFVSVPENKNDAQIVVDEFKSVFANNTLKIGQNIKYDIAILRNYNIEIRGKLFDTMLAHYIIQPETRHNMDILSQNYLNYKPVSIETLIGKKGKSQLSMREVPTSQLVAYACEDADITLQLKNSLEKELKKVNGEKVFNDIEMPLVPVLFDMEHEGIAINIEGLHQYSKELTIDLLKLRDEIISIAGCEFNIDSPKQLGDVLFEVLKVQDKPKKTKTGQYATGEDILSKLKGKHPIIEKILDYRQLNKLKNTYVDTLPSLVNKKTGRVHTTFNQALAATGRLSSINPNLQNIPIRTDKGREVRKAFVARDSQHVLLSADYSQIELRIMAHLSEDANMADAFNKNLDIHSATASKVFDVDIEKVTSDMRRKAKMVNFGIIYGISAFGLSQRLNIPRGEAKEIIDQYFEQYPGVKTFMDVSIEKAKQNGFVKTIMGRKRYLADINSRNYTVRGFAERNAINAPIQGSAADIIKIAMINIHQFMLDNKLKSKMLLQVHDELVFDAFYEELDLLEKQVKTLMENAVSLNVPLTVETGSGPNWLDAH